MCSCLKFLLSVKSFLWPLVEQSEVWDVRLLVNKVWERVVELSYQHTKLSSPVSDMVNPFDFVAKEFEDPTDWITLDGAAQMTNMHIFRDVRTWEVY